jgi:hypothetical protein
VESNGFGKVLNRDLICGEWMWDLGYDVIKVMGRVVIGEIL